MCVQRFNNTFNVYILNTLIKGESATEFYVVVLVDMNTIYSERDYIRSI